MKFEALSAELTRQVQAWLEDRIPQANFPIEWQSTRKEFEGDLTLVVFPFTKALQQKPEEIGNALGTHLVQAVPELVCRYNVIKGFLNLVVNPAWWSAFLLEHHADPLDLQQTAPQHYVVEFSSPNTNKPLHLGHLRNNFLGDALSRIIAANGHQITRVCLVNDRGIHICKSMLAYMKYGQGETPESSGLKGDQLVVKYYVRFEAEYKAQVKQYISDHGWTEVQAEKDVPLMQEARVLLQQWEEGNPEVITLWKAMNSWVYAGFDATYKSIGISFDKFYYESDTYSLGKALVHEGLDSGVFYRKKDGSVWVDLTADGLDHKALLRSDGTSMYITQDLGTADLRYRDFHMDHSLYVIGNEQDYHMKVLRLVLSKLGKPYADGIRHISYGMVELPTGRMKTREGTVVDADDIVAEVAGLAKAEIIARGREDDFSQAEAEKLFAMIGVGSLKYFILKVSPEKKMVYNPEESVSLQGDTGAFIQYAHARAMAVSGQARARGIEVPSPDGSYIPEQVEIDLLARLAAYPEALRIALRSMDPAHLAAYLMDLAKAYNRMYHDVKFLTPEAPQAMAFRLLASATTARYIGHGMNLLGIQVPDRM